MYTSEEMSEEAVRPKIETEVQDLSDKEIKDKLPSYRQTETLATLHMDNKPVAPSVITAFAALADAFHGTSTTKVQIAISGYSQVITREYTRAGLIDMLVQEEQARMSTANYQEREAAKKEAERQEQQTEIERLREQAKADLQGNPWIHTTLPDPE